MTIKGKRMELILHVMELILHVMEFFRRATQLSWSFSLKLSLVTKVNSAIHTQHPTTAALVLQYVFDPDLLIEQRQMRNIVKNAKT